MTTLPTPSREVTQEEHTDFEPPYAVILHNDEVNTMAHVVESLLQCVPSLDHRQAAEIMLEAHSNGQARVIVCPLERAEAYRDCLQSRGLRATIEKA